MLLLKSAQHILCHDHESNTLILSPTEWLLVIVVPSIHGLDILLFLYVLSFASSIPLPQTHTIAGTTSHLLRKVAGPDAISLILQESSLSLA